MSAHIGMHVQQIARKEYKGENMFGKIKEMLNDTKAQMDSGVMDLVIAFAIGLLVLVAVFQLAPVVGDKISTATVIEAGSDWNSTENTNIPTGVQVWTDNAELLLIVVLVVIVGLAILYIRGLQGAGGMGGY